MFTVGNAVPPTLTMDTKFPSEYSVSGWYKWVPPNVKVKNLNVNFFY